MEENTYSPGGVWVLGFFDGVHRGHRALIDAAREMAGDGCVGIWTFRTLPKAKELLTTPDEREALLRQAGADAVHFADFETVHAMDGEAFFRDELCAKLRPAGLVCGFNFRFGYRGGAGADDLARWGREAGIPVRVLPAMESDGCVISSTWIRRLVAEGDVERAREMLTCPYTIRGVVEHGKHLGHTLGFPTVNLRLTPGKVAPKSGIYAAMVRYPEGGTTCAKPGVCNIGSRPTVNDDARDVTVETYILDCHTDLYGAEIAVSLYSYLRGERRFPDLAALSAQIGRDAEATARYFAESGSDEAQNNGNKTE